MAETTNYQCPNCNGRLSFNGQLGKLQCEFCESAFTPEEVERIYAERQERADAKAAGGREGEAAAEVAGDPSAQAAPGAAGQQGLAGVPAVNEQQLAEIKAEQQRIIDEGTASGKSSEEIADEIAAVNTRYAQAAAAQAPLSAAAASGSQAAQVHVEGPVAGEDPIDTYLRNAHWDDLDEANLRSYNCPSCGAQLMVDQVTAVTSCPYCGNNTVVPGQLSDILKPDYVIPFKLGKADAVAALKSYYGGKRFLPRGFTEGNHLEEVQGVYVPFWLYSGTGSGDVTFNARNIRTWSDSENNYVETDHFLLTRSGSMEFARVPVDGSTKMPDAHMDAIEPFDYSELQPFSVAYLPGYLTDRYDQGAKTCEERAGKRVEVTCIDTLRSTATGYNEVDLASASTSLNLNDVAYALLPVWMLHTKWEGEDYLFAMNGQTGKLVGDLPIDRGKVVRTSLLMFLPLAIVLFIVVYFTMGFGI